MERFNDLANVECAARASTHWANFVHAHQWYLIPPTLQCDITFARSSHDVYYLEAMHTFSQRHTDSHFSESFAERDTPLATIREELVGRWWSRFNLLPLFRIEQMIVQAYRVMVP